MCSSLLPVDCGSSHTLSLSLLEGGAFMAEFNASSFHATFAERSGHLWRPKPLSASKLGLSLRCPNPNVLFSWVVHFAPAVTDVPCVFGARCTVLARSSHGSFRKVGVPYFEVLIIRILVFRVLHQGPLFPETPTCFQGMVSNTGSMSVFSFQWWWHHRRSANTADSFLTLHMSG